MERLFSKVLRTRPLGSERLGHLPKITQQAHTRGLDITLPAPGPGTVPGELGNGVWRDEGSPCVPWPPGPSSLCPCSWRDLLATHCGRDADNQSWSWTFPPPPSTSQAWRQGQTPTREWTRPEVREVSCASGTHRRLWQVPPACAGVLGAEATRRSPHLACLGLGCARSG